MWCGGPAREFREGFRGLMLPVLQAGTIRRDEGGAPCRRNPWEWSLRGAMVPLSRFSSAGIFGRAATVGVTIPAISVAVIVNAVTWPQRSADLIAIIRIIRTVDQRSGVMDVRILRKRLRRSAFAGESLSLAVNFTRARNRGNPAGMATKLLRPCHRLSVVHH